MVGSENVCSAFLNKIYSPFFLKRKHLNMSRHLKIEARGKETEEALAALFQALEADIAIKNNASLQSKLTKVKEEVLKDQQVISTQQNAIQDMVQSLQHTKDTSKKNLLVESAVDNGVEFRTYVRMQLQEIKADLLQSSASTIEEKKLETFEENFIPASPPNKLPTLSDSIDENDASKLSLLGKTRIYTAAARAHESQRAGTDRIIYDPYAKAFAGRYGEEFLRKISVDLRSTPEYLSTFVAFRTKFIDDSIVSCLHEDRNLKQLVFLGAGGDSRAYRLPKLPVGLHVYYIDHEDVIRYRSKVFAQVRNSLPWNDAKDREERIVVKEIACNISQPGWSSALCNEGFDPKKKSIIVIEGLLVYLSNDLVTKLFSELQHKVQLESESIIIGDVPNVANTRLEYVRKVWTKYAQGMCILYVYIYTKFGLDMPETFFEKFGYSAIEIEEIGIGKSNYFNRCPKEYVQIMTKSKRRSGDRIPRLFVFSLEKE
ncbi:O-methyltransferase [Reticulomyxa filosa]|uniref:O-methyltransferase n=1 Tax=Reticulomyxa filosa TaxID=46433 RepID=X6ME95_RETFI|nr:O-methyltransferase [Reticulomyxa filosa]|eukprot:ETO12229.1 O-methyltransferase [Reticulomyxa filosa]